MDVILYKFKDEIDQIFPEWMHRWAIKNCPYSWARYKALEREINRLSAGGGDKEKIIELANRLLKTAQGISEFFRSGIKPISQVAGQAKPAWRPMRTRG